MPSEKDHGWEDIPSGGHQIHVGAEMIGVREAQTPHHLLDLMDKVLWAYEMHLQEDF